MWRTSSFRLVYLNNLKYNCSKNTWSLFKNRSIRPCWIWSQTENKDIIIFYTKPFRRLFYENTIFRYTIPLKIGPVSCSALLCPMSQIIGFCKHTSMCNMHSLVYALRVKCFITVLMQYYMLYIGDMMHIFLSLTHWLTIHYVAY